MSVSPIIDLSIFEQLMKEMGTDFMDRLVDTYLEDTTRLLNELHQSFSDKDIEAFRRAAHTIKTTSNSFGAMQFGALARELELIGAEKDWDIAAVKLNHLDADYAQVRAALLYLSRGSLDGNPSTDGNTGSI